MTKNFFISLCDPEFPKVTDGGASQLRSARERKAAGGGGGVAGRRGGRRMKPGKAKTLGDLPKINS